MDHQDTKQDRDDFRGRSRNRDLEKHMNKDKFIRPSPPPKALGNRGPRRFCTFCSSKLGKRTANRESHQEIARNMSDDVFVLEFRRQKPLSFGGMK